MATVDQPVSTGESPVHDGDTLQDPRRRDYMSIGAVAFAGVGVGVIALPLVNSMSPAADTLALSTTELDISGIEVGQSIKSTFRKQPLFVRHLTPAEIAAADAVSLADLRDPQSLADRTKAGKAEWLITLGVCTHLGCVPLGAGEGENKGPFGGYFCPCHASAYDTAGRIRSGPAPTNLVVPPYEFTSDTTILVGEV